MTQTNPEKEQRAKLAFEIALAKITPPEFWEGMDDKALADKLKAGAEWIFQQGIIFGVTEFGAQLQKDFTDYVNDRKAVKMTTQFSTSLQYTLTNEGGFVNNPKDPGGATNFGITIETLSQWRGVTCTVDDVKNLTVAEASEIYLSYYWNPLMLFQINNQSVATAIFDIGVNDGIENVTRFIQHVANVAVDGVIGPDTITAVNNMDPKVFMGCFVSRVISHYNWLVTEKPEEQEFLADWLKRANRLYTLEV